MAYYTTQELVVVHTELSYVRENAAFGKRMGLINTG
jgi:hypothetical protein